MNNATNSDVYEEQFSSKYMLGIPIMGIDTDGSVVIDGQRTRTDVRDLSIESAGVLVLPFSNEQDSSTISNHYEELFLENFNHFISTDIGKYASYVFGDDDVCRLVETDTDNKSNCIKKNIKTSQKSDCNLPKCIICLEEFSNKVELNKHKTIHGRFSQWKCAVCEKSFSQPSNLWKHIRSHTGERPYICDVCNKGFTQLANLQKHKLVHTGEKPFNCPDCGKSFSQQANMLKHQLLHTGEKPFVCVTCNKGFTQKSNLAKHELLHTGEKPYTCKVCSKSFTQQSNLKKHECRHINHRPYCCEVCDKRYIQKVSLDRHKLKCKGPTPTNNSDDSTKKLLEVPVDSSDNSHSKIAEIQQENQ